MQAFNAINMREEDTIKRCPPFVDAMTRGFLIPLICDLRIENGAITGTMRSLRAERCNSRARRLDFMTQAKSSARHCSSLTAS